MRRACEHVYVMTAGPNVKIGATCDPENRRATLSRYDGHRVVLIQSWHRPSTARAVEWLALWYLRECRDYGEWCIASKDAGVKAVLWAMRALERRAIPLRWYRLPRCIRAVVEASPHHWHFY